MNIQSALESPVAVAQPEFDGVESAGWVPPASLAPIIRRVLDYLPMRDRALAARVSRIFYQQTCHPSENTHTGFSLNNTAVERGGRPARIKMNTALAILTQNLLFSRVNQFAQKEFLNIRINQWQVRQWVDILGHRVNSYVTQIFTDTVSRDSQLFLNNVSFTSKCKYLNIILIKADGDIKHIQLPVDLSSRILQFLKDGRPDPEFCCYDFVNYSYNKDNELNEFELSDWKKQQYLGDESLFPGDAVLLRVSAEAQPRPSEWRGRHVAIYLGYNAYISLCGTGPILFSSMDHMQQAYEAKSVLVLKP
jgi:hypothetical protein